MTESNGGAPDLFADLTPADLEWTDTMHLLPEELERRIEESRQHPELRRQRQRPTTVDLEGEADWR